MTKKIDYSIVTATSGDVKKMSAIFLNPNDKVEVIFVSRRGFKEETLKTLKQIDGFNDFAQVTCAPAEMIYNYPTDISESRNTGIMYAEGKRVILMDDAIELKFDFWDLLKEDDGNFESGTILLCQKLHGDLNNEKWHNYMQKLLGLTTRFKRINDPNFTLSFGVVDLDTLLKINGYNILFDMGFWFEDTELLARCLISGAPVILDTKLMGYKYKHKLLQAPLHTNKWVYQVLLEEIKNGKYYAYNPYDLREMRIEKLKEKDKWVVK